MAFVHGKRTVVTVDGTDLSTFIKASEFGVSVDSHDVTHYGVDNKEYQAGLIDGTFSMDGTYDNGGAGSPKDTLLALQGGPAVTVVRQVEGAGSALPQDSFSAILLGYDEPSPVDDMVTWSAEFQISGPVDRTPQA